MRKMLAVLLLALVALGIAAERTIRLEDKEFTIEVNASAVKADAEEAREPMGSFHFKSIPQSKYEEYGISPLGGGGGDETWAESTLTYDSYDGYWKDYIKYVWSSASKQMYMWGYTKRVSAPDYVNYIEIEFAYRINFLKFADWNAQSKWLHTGAYGHRIAYSYHYAKDTEKSDSQTCTWEDGYSRLFRFFTGHAGYVPNQAGDFIYHDTHDKSVPKPDGYVRENA
ncbi:MAG: hypothetical protein ABIL25_08835 [candidate division WOR-3 bacterium]